MFRATLHRSFPSIRFIQVQQPCSTVKAFKRRLQQQQEASHVFACEQHHSNVIEREIPPHFSTSFTVTYTDERGTAHFDQVCGVDSPSREQADTFSALRPGV